MLAFTALADPNRFRIVEMLGAKGALAASDIADRFTISAPAVSQHLKVLREARLVEVEVKAQQRIYRLNRKTIGEIEDWAVELRLHWEESFDRLDALLAKQNRLAKKPKRRKS